MGNRLIGVKVDISDNIQMVSCPMAPGTIQCPENGLPIVLGCDSQTLGGYPRILQIAATDLHLIGQLRPNDTVSFEKISVDQARKELMKQNSLFNYLQ
jgi:allophanate hydrolase subunit 2